MTVKELIQQLQQFDPDLRVYRRNLDFGSDERYESDEAEEIERVAGPGNYLKYNGVLLS